MEERAEEKEAKAEAAEDTRDEEEWERVIENLAAAGEAVSQSETPDPGVFGQESISRESLPDLGKSLEKVPESSRDLIDELFRGHFIGMKAIEREKLY